MTPGGHGEYLDLAISKLDEMICLIRERQVLLLSPQALERQQIEIDAIRPTDQPQLKRVRIYRHRGFRQRASDEYRIHGVYPAAGS